MQASDSEGTGSLHRKPVRPRGVTAGRALAAEWETWGATHKQEKQAGAIEAATDWNLRFQHELVLRLTELWAAFLGIDPG